MLYIIINVCIYQLELKDLLKELYTKAADKWEDIGILIGVDSRTLDALKATHKDACQSCLREMLKVWLKITQPPPTWSTIVEALTHLGDEQLAIYLKQKYVSQ